MRNYILPCKRFINVKKQETDKNHTNIIRDIQIAKNEILIKIALHG